MTNHFREKLFNTLIDRFNYDPNCGHTLESEFQYVGDLNDAGVEFRSKTRVKILEPINPNGQCLCGKTGLKQYGVLLHKPTRITIAIGKTCIKNYIGVTDLICQDCPHVCRKNSVFCPSCDDKHKNAIRERLPVIKMQARNHINNDLCNLQMHIPIEDNLNLQEQYLIFLYHPSFAQRVNDDMIDRLRELLQLRNDTIEELYNQIWTEGDSFRTELTEKQNYVYIHQKVMLAAVPYTYTTDIQSNSTFGNMKYLFDLVYARNRWNEKYPDWIY